MRERWRVAEGGTSWTVAGRRRLQELGASLPRADPYVVAAAALALALPLAAIVSALRHPWAPSGDWAFIELDVRKVGTGDTPLVGTYSRFGWRHPGPLPFYAMALPYRLVSADHGLLFAASTVNLASALGCIALLARYPRHRAVVGLLGLTAFERGLGAGTLSDPWNPVIALMPFALYLFLCVEMVSSAGREDRPGRWSGPLAVFVGSFAVQAHLALIVPVLLIGGSALALRRWRLRASRAARSETAETIETAEAAEPRRWAHRLGPAVLGLGVGLAVWAPPLDDQLRGSGNLGTIYRWARGDWVAIGPYERGHLSASQYWGSLAWLFHPLGAWAGRVGWQRVPLHATDPLTGSASLALMTVVVVMLAGVTRAAWRHRDRSRAAAPPDGALIGVVVVALAGTAAALINLAGQQGLLFFYVVRWTGAIVMMLWIAVGWAVVARLHLDRSPAIGRLAVALPLAASLILVGLGLVHGSVGKQPGPPHFSQALLQMEPAIERIPEEDEPVVSSIGVWALMGSQNQSLVVLLERQGVRWVEPFDPEGRGHPLYDIVFRNHRPLSLWGEHVILARVPFHFPRMPANELLLIRRPGP